MELYQYGIHELRERLDKREISSQDITDSVFGRISAVEDRIKAYVTLTHDEAAAMSRAADSRIA
ncbi:MAG: Asp-tRNA(Asn)/Glu-tRNA(Gln) amidotransferase GatCAB subunit A, partial [Thermodesulfovibrio sp.]|nr:Asp-tRNA(Asn)/Glu-tRNA(Gln) amidotransferase GatCAB subunit A [Thermodesulfovibrio sp.]